MSIIYMVVANVMKAIDWLIKILLVLFLVFFEVC